MLNRIDNMQPLGRPPYVANMQALAPYHGSMAPLQLTPPAGGLNVVSALRERIRRRVEHDLRCRHPHRVEWQAKCSMMAKQIEGVLYRRAKTLSEYGDESTIATRLQELAKSRSTRKHDVGTMETDRTQPLLEMTLRKARFYGLEPEEVDVLFNHLYGKTPVSFTGTPSGAERLLPGRLFHTSADKPHDSLNWNTMPSIAVNYGPNGGGFEVILSNMGQPKLFMTQAFNSALRLWKRVYFSTFHPGSLLVHYLSELPSATPIASHEVYCGCLECSFVKSNSIATYLPAAKRVSTCRAQDTYSPEMLPQRPPLDSSQIYTIPSDQTPSGHMSFIKKSPEHVQDNELGMNKRLRRMD